MGDSREIRECEDCQYLIKKYGRNKLYECPNCGHLYSGEKCTCGAE